LNAELLLFFIFSQADCNFFHDELSTRRVIYIIGYYLKKRLKPEKMRIIMVLVAHNLVFALKNPYIRHT
jgi:hypothetical protein